MVFSSMVFLFRFLPFVLAIYYITPKKFRNFILFLASLIFYAWGEPKYIVLMIFSTVLDYSMGRGIAYFRKKQNEIGARICLLISVLGNVSLLGIFKYADFIIDTINFVSRGDIPLWHLALPVGISFYTFQTMSYTIDVYRGQVGIQKNIIAFGTYVSMFPQLIAGPIVRYKTIAEELTNRRENVNDFAQGVMRFSIGMGKKVLIADSLGRILYMTGQLPITELSALKAFLALLAGAFQLYFDFSGYSDMAIGLGLMFGFHFPENFNYPFMAKSLRELWSKWDITLITWMREYIYIPMGGSRRKKGRVIFNIMVLWFIVGIWHGAAWSYAIWGLLYGVATCVEVFLLKDVMKKWPNVLRHIYTMGLFTLIGIVYMVSEVPNKQAFLLALVGGGGKGFIDTGALYLIVNNLVLWIFAVIGSTSYPMEYAKKFLQKHEKFEIPAKAGFAGLCLLLSLIYMISDSYNPFLYFRF